MADKSKTFIERIIFNPIVQTIVLFVSGGWIILEITEYFIGNFGLNEKARIVVLIILISILPIALFLSWYLTKRRAQESQNKTDPQKITSEVFQNGKLGKIKYLIRKPQILIPTILISVAIIITILSRVHHQSKVKWAKTEGFEEIERLSEDGFYIEAFNLAKKAEKYIPKDTVLYDLLSGTSSILTIHTDPPGAGIYWKEYSDTSNNWIYVGETPIDSLEVPKFTVYRFKIIMAGYDTVFGVVQTTQDNLSRKLWKTGEIPEDMVYVDGYWEEVEDTWEEDLGFFIDKYEVTNRQFMEFVNHGGYRIRDYWKHEFIKEGNKLSWKEAMAEFIDLTGRPGPSTWEAGDYPDGQDGYPVSGVSWYEAVAYAEFAGKVLPTADHWDSPVGYKLDPAGGDLSRTIIPLSNFDDAGPVEVGEKEGISFFGAYDMAGNVREWCWNKSPVGRIISGASYEGPTYMFLQWDQLPPFDRSQLNGFRCAIYKDRKEIPETAFRFIDLDLKNERDCTSETPVPESTFQIYKNQFLYDKKNLKAVVEMKDVSADDWVMEKVTFDAAYENQKMIAYLFLPKNSSPPYQTLIFFPGSYAHNTNKDFLTTATGNVNAYLNYVLKSGRAAVYPVYTGTYERNYGQIPATNKSHEYTDLLVKLVKDFSRTIDYLETRDDIDTGKLAYYGHSWGGNLGAIIPAVENRLSLNILVAAGFPTTKPYPEADEINYISRVKIPTLILNGRYDAIFPLENNVKPFFNLLGTPENDKRLYLIDAGHNFYKRDRIKPTLEWCDKYFGPPNYLQNE